MITQGVIEQFGTQVLGAGFNAVKQSRFVAFHSGTLAARRGAHENKRHVCAKSAKVESHALVIRAKH